MVTVSQIHQIPVAKKTLSYSHRNRHRLGGDRSEPRPPIEPCLPPAPGPLSRARQCEHCGHWACARFVPALR